MSDLVNGAIERLLIRFRGLVHSADFANELQSRVAHLVMSR
jgi:hypothetical protein